MNKQKVTQQEVNFWIDNIVSQILSSGKQYDYVVGIERGGLNLSLPLSKILGIPHEAVKISFYDCQTNWPGVVAEVSGNFVWKPNGLIADDLIDRGRTISEFKTRYGEADVAVLLWAKDATHYTQEPEYFGALKPESWIVFPWET